MKKWEIITAGQKSYATSWQPPSNLLMTSSESFSSTSQPHGFTYVSMSTAALSKRGPPTYSHAAKGTQGMAVRDASTEISGVSGRWDSAGYLREAQCQGFSEIKDLRSLSFRWNHPEMLNHKLLEDLYLPPTWIVVRGAWWVGFM